MSRKSRQDALGQRYGQAEMPCCGQPENAAQKHCAAPSSSIGKCPAKGWGAMAMGNVIWFEENDGLNRTLAKRNGQTYAGNVGYWLKGALCANLLL